MSGLENLRANLPKSSECASPNRSAKNTVLAPTTPMSSRPAPCTDPSELASRLAHVGLNDTGLSKAAGSAAHDDDDTCDAMMAAGTVSRGLGAALCAFESNEQMIETDTTVDLIQLSATLDHFQMSVQSVNTLIFEIQELRHASVSTPLVQPTASNETSPANTVDLALARFETAMSSLATYHHEVKACMRQAESSPNIQRSGEAFVRLERSFEGCNIEWSALVQDAEVLREEFTEDKWLTVFQTVSQQAEEMMRSLQKIIQQCQQFIAEINERSLDGAVLDAELVKSCQALQKSLHAKAKHYVPATDRVLTILGKGIADRTTKNGVASRTYSDLKTRWKTLSDQVSDMQDTMNKFHVQTGGGRRGEPITASASLDMYSPSSRGAQVNPSTVTPPRPVKSPARRPAVSMGLSPPQTPSGRLNGRRSVSNLEGSISSSARSNRGAPSPGPILSNTGRPRWSTTLNPTTDQTKAPTRFSLSSSHNASEQPSALGIKRPSSRMSICATTSRSYGERPVSPTFSDASSSCVRDRPSTPSKIPQPASAQRRQSTTAFIDLHGAGTEHTSIMQRVMSPTVGTPQRPSLGASRGASSRRLSVASGLEASHMSSARAPSPSLSASSYGRGAMTPEPKLIAQARRLSHARMPSSAMRPPPVPRVPSTYRRESMLHVPRDMGVGSAQRRYVPNKIDPLDIAIAHIVNTALPTQVCCSRADLPLTLSQAEQCEILTARYHIDIIGSATNEYKPITCKLVDKVGPRAIKGEKKVLVRVGTGWQEFEAYVKSLLALF